MAGNSKKLLSGPSGWILLIAAVAVVSVLVLTRVSDGPSLLHSLEHRSEAISRDRSYRSIDEAASTSDRVVVGRVVGVTEGVGMNWEIDELGEEKRLLVEYGAPDALVNSIHLTLEVDDVLAESGSGLADGPREIVVGLIVNDPVDVASAQRELEDLGSLVLLLVEDSDVFDYAPEVWAVLEDGGFMGQLGPDGRVVFPVLEDPEVLLGDELSVGIDELR
jgi:hypothetical protein